MGTHFKSDPDYEVSAENPLVPASRKTLDKAILKVKTKEIPAKQETPEEIDILVDNIEYLRINGY
jgi:hypothetical protein